MFQPFALLLGVASLWYFRKSFHPSLFGLTFGLFFLYLPFVDRLPFNLAPGVNLVTLFLVTLACLRHTADNEETGRAGTAFRSLLLAWITVGTVAFIVSLGSAPSFSQLVVLFKRWLDPLLFGLLALSLTRRGDRRFVFACLIIGYTLVSVQGLREGFDIGHKSRIRGLMGQANELGAFLAMYAPLVLVAALSLVRGVKKGALFGLLIVGAWALMYTESRASLLALPLGVCALLMASGRVQYSFIGLFLVLILWAFPSLLPEKATERFESTYVEDMSGTGTQLEISAASRLDIWEGAMRMIAEHPLGVGFAQFQQMIPQYAPTRVYAMDAHNYYILTWAEFGFVGLAILLALLGCMLVNAWLLAKRATDPFLRALGLGMCASLIAALFVNFFGTRLMDIQVSTYLWVLSAVAAAARAPMRENEEVEEVSVDAAPVRINAWGLRSYS